VAKALVDCRLNELDFELCWNGLLNLPEMNMHALRKLYHQARLLREKQYQRLIEEGKAEPDLEVGFAQEEDPNVGVAFLVSPDEEVIADFPILARVRVNATSCERCQGTGQLRHVGRCRICSECNGGGTRSVAFEILPINAQDEAANIAEGLKRRRRPTGLENALPEPWPSKESLRRH
jgi:hypothetical protein